MAKNDATEQRSLRPFFILWSGQAVSLIGSQLVQFALIWWLTKQTGSATVLAIASIVGLVPQVVLGPFVGVLVDRWNRRLVMLGADFAVALTTLGLAALFWSGSAEIWHVYLALFVRSLCGSFHWPAMTASTSLMVPQDQLTRIQGLNQILNGGLNIAAAPLGALLVSLLPVESVLMIDVGTAAVAILAIFFLKIPQPKREPVPQSQSTLGTYWADLRAGLRYVLNWRGLLILSIVAMSLNMVLSPTTSFMPLLVTDYFEGSAWHLGTLQAGFSVGILIGGVALSVWGGFKRRILTSLVGVFGIGASILFVGLTPASLFPLAVGSMLLGGVMSSLANGPIMAIFQSTIEPGMQGRVLALINSLTMGMMPLGLAVAGPLADIIGVRTWFIAGGLFTLTMAIVCNFIPSLMNIEKDRDDHVDAAEKTPTSISSPVVGSAEII